MSVSVTVHPRDADFTVYSCKQTAHTEYTDSLFDSCLPQLLLFLLPQVLI